MSRKVRNKTGAVCFNTDGKEFTYLDDGTRDRHNNILYKVIFKSGYSTYVQANKIVTGNIHDYGSPTIHGVGCTDYKGASYEPEYKLWIKIFHRCYSTSYHKRFPSYTNCSVDLRWHHYSHFKNDINKICNYKECLQYNDGKRLVIDKDILVYKNKQYSLQTCCIVPEPINIFITNVKSDNTSGLIGVHKRHSHYVVVFSYKNQTIQGGTYSNPVDAVNAYYQHKLCKLADLLIQYDWIDDRVKTGLYAYFDKQKEEQLRIALALQKIR